MIFSVTVIDKGRVIKSGTVDSDNEKEALREIEEDIDITIGMWIDIKEIKNK